jgi:ribonuclease R
VESYGLFVEGVKLPAQGLVRVETLRDDTYRFDRASHTLAGYRAGSGFRLGDLVRVAVARVDLERREIDFRVVEGKRQAPPAGTARGVKAAKYPERAGARRDRAGRGKRR